MNLTLAELTASPWASCGPASLATLLGRPLADIRHAFPNQRDGKTWTNLRMMQQAIAILRHEEATETSGNCDAPVPWATRGLALISFRGSWDVMGPSHPASLQRTHWIAVKPHPTLTACPLVFDINTIDYAPPMSLGWWDPLEVWEALIVPQLVASYGKRATGKWWTRAFVDVMT